MSEANHIDESRDMRCLERISALADGRLRGAEFVQAVEAIDHDSEARAAWQAYHVLGDVLRLGETAALGAGNGFAARFAARLAREAPLERPVAAAGVTARNAAEVVSASEVSESSNRLHKREPAANSPVFRWKMVAGLAIGVAVGAVGWNLFDTASVPANGRLAQLAGADSSFQAKLDGGAAKQAGASVPVRHDVSPPMLRDPRLDELLAAHEQSGGVSALQMPAGFLRNATFESRGR